MSDRPLRICMLTTFYPPFNFGGDGIFVERLAAALARRGHHVEVIHSLDAYRFLGGDAAYVPPASNPRRHSLKSLIPGISALMAHQTGRPALYRSRIRKILERGRFDVLHYHNPSLLGGPGLFACGNAVKLYTTHEHWLLCPTHVLWRYRRELCTRKTCFFCTLHAGRPPQLWRFGSLLPRMVQTLDAILCPSRFTCEKHRQEMEEMGHPEKKCGHPQVIHLPHFLPSESLVEFDRTLPPYFLAVGRLEKLKGFQTLIPVFAGYKRAELWIAGEGGYESTLRRMSRGNPRIRFLGQRSALELRSLYRNAIALLVPSLCCEAFGLVAIEAFAQDTPAIARRLGALAEVIEDSGGGYLYSTPGELVECMERLQQDVSLRERLGRSGAHALRTLWTEDTHISRYLELIRRLQDEKACPKRT